MEFPSIVKTFKNLFYYLKYYKYKILVFTNNNNQCWFIDIKILTSRQICYTQTLSCYYFQLIIIRSKLIEQWIYYCTFFKEINVNKTTFKIIILKFYIVFNLYLLI